MSSVNENTPSTSSSNTNSERPDNTNETSTPSPSSSAPNNAALDVHALKERIIATNKLFKYLQDAKKGKSLAKFFLDATLKANLGLSVKNSQESDEKYNKVADQVKVLEDQLKAKSFQIDSLKNDLRKQADLAKRMGSNAAEFRTAKDQVAKLKEENQKLTETISKLQAEKDQMDEEAMETSINHNLTIESLREEITDLQSSLTTDDSELVSLRLQLSAEKSKASKAALHIKSLEQSLQQSNEQIKELNVQLLEKEPQQAPTSATNDNMDNIKRMHAEQVNSLKQQISQLDSKLERKAALPPTTQSAANPTLLKKYHQLKGKYQLMKKTNVFLNQELQSALSNASEDRGLTSDSDPDSASHESSDDANIPTLVDLETSLPESAKIPTANQHSSTLPRPKSANASKAPPVSLVQHRNPSRDPRLAHQPNQHQETEELGLQQKSGLIAPPPQGTATKLPKKRKSLLLKFVNAKNPSKVLERAKAPTASNTTALALSKKRSHSSIQNDDQATESASNQVDSAPANAAAATTSTTASTASSSATDVPSKRIRADYHWNHVIEGIFNKSHGKVLPTRVECKEITLHLLDEIQDCYSRIKSAAVLTDSSLVPFGASDLELPKSMDHREKVYAWFLVSLLKVDRQEFNSVMFKLAESTKNCPVSKAPINNKLVRLIRLFAIVCKAEDSLGRLCTLVYTLLRIPAFQSSLIPSLLNVGFVWKESFAFVSADPHFDSLHNTFVSCIHLVSCRSSSTKNLKQMEAQLSTLFNWPPPKLVLDCIEDSMKILQSTYFKELHANDRSKFDLLSFNLITSFELALVVLDDWKQTYDIFIRQRLWPLLSMEVIDVVAMELLGKLARLGISDDPLKADKPGVVTLLDTFSTIIDLGKDIDPSEKHLQFAAARSMVAVAGNHHHYKKFLANVHGI
ncbi:hypothetical protein BD408DRAFT_434336 [Parasitella parasitica]|nr:hypothetical protein BD408DRAFT_434336 [Parasitella parasitica]